MSVHVSKPLIILILLLAALYIGGQSLVPAAAQTPLSTPTDTPTQTPAPTPTAAPTSNILLLGSDICRYDYGGTDYTPNCKKTGDLIRSVLAANPAALVQTAGDNVNNEPPPASYDAEYMDVYAPNWGSFLSVTHAAMGNHDLLPPGGATPYFSYFGSAAGPAPGGYYSYNIGSSWHVIVLNSNCSIAGGCGSGSAQYIWLNTDLAANTGQCILAVWHHPRWSSGQFGGTTISAPWWDLLYQYKADIVVNGHNHNYERFDLIDPSEQAASDGIREFLVGTGGAPGHTYTYAEHPLDPNEAIRNQSRLYGVLQLTLNSSSYSWEFPAGRGLYLHRFRHNRLPCRNTSYPNPAVHSHRYANSNAYSNTHGNRHANSNANPVPIVSANDFPVK